MYAELTETTELNLNSGQILVGMSHIIQDNYVYYI